MGTTICIGGLIGAGKTTFAKNLLAECEKRSLSCRFLPELYTSASRTMIRSNLPAMDAFMFGHRLQMTMDAPDIAKVYDIVLIERCFIDHLAFTKAFATFGYVSQEFDEWAQKVVEEVAPPSPDCYVYLDVSPEVAFERKLKRGSSNDGLFNLELTKEIKKAYDAIIPKYCDHPIVLDWSDFGSQFSFDALLDRFQLTAH